MTDSYFSYVDLFVACVFLFLVGLMVYSVFRTFFTKDKNEKENR